MAMAIIKPPTSKRFVFDIYLAATAPDDIRPRDGNKMYGNNAVTEIGNTSKIQKQAILMRQYLEMDFNEFKLCHFVSFYVIFMNSQKIPVGHILTFPTLAFLERL